MKQHSNNSDEDVETEQVLTVEKELSPQAKKLIVKELKTLNEDFQKAINEVNLYKWVGRVFIAFLGLGSIGAYFTFNDFLEKKIGERISLVDNFYVAINHGNCYCWTTFFILE